jgi:acyl-CoA reductase-like NAD-dependent aldehyde dehydrogenase
MREETFGPAVAIIKVDSDEEAVHLMNESEPSVSAAIFSVDSLRAEEIADALDTGTVFFNPCDNLASRGTGVKNSRLDCVSSSVDFELLTRPKSYHFGITRETGTARL